MSLIFNDFNSNNLQYMIQNNIHQNALYLYYDNIEELCTYISARFSAILRPYNQFNPKNNIPQSCGIPIANKKGGFQKLTKQVYAYITLAFDDIQALIDKHHYTNVIVPVKDDKPFNQLYCLSNDVSEFIMKKINSLKLKSE
jgi:hypothetical protein